MSPAPFNSTTHRILRTLVQDSRGLILSTELTLFATLAVVGLIVGVTSVRDAAVSELSDIAGAVQDLTQNYAYLGTSGHSSQTHGSDFIDASDFCDDPEDLSLIHI